MEGECELRRFKLPLMLGLPPASLRGPHEGQEGDHGCLSSESWPPCASEREEETQDSVTTHYACQIQQAGVYTQGSWRV
jgi:hypothetical protein